MCAFAGSGGATHLDTQTVTTGASGTAINQDRVRGYNSGIGSISPGTSAIYSAPITELAWYENSGSPVYILSITGATNTGWSTLTIGSTVLSGSAATYVGGGWQWNTTDTVSTQAFGANGSVHPCYFD